MGNRTGASVSGFILVHTQEFAALEVAPGQSARTELSLHEIRRVITDQRIGTGQLQFRYTGQEGESKAVELFGYVDPADSYLAGKSIRVEIPSTGNPVVQVLSR